LTDEALHPEPVDAALLGRNFLSKVVLVYDGPAGVFALL